MGPTMQTKMPSSLRSWTGASTLSHGGQTSPAPANEVTPASAGRATAAHSSGGISRCTESGRRPRILFLVMSAVSKAGTVDQLAHALAPHQVLVHHDVSQTPDFELHAPNVLFVPQPKRTGWAVFGFVEAIFHSLAHALTHLDFDYVQLLSPACLPIKPMADFERHVSGTEDAHFDCIDLLQDRDALMSVGYRAFTAENSLLHRAARRLPAMYFGNSTARRDEAGVWLRSGGGQGLLPALAATALQALSRTPLGRQLPGQALRPYYGSTWFGARRHIAEGMLQAMQRPGMYEHFSRVRIAEEFLIPSLIMQLRPRKGPLNHCIQTFHEAHPGTFGLQDMNRLRRTPAWFARKFADDPDAPVRLQVLSELVGITQGAASADGRQHSTLQRAPGSPPRSPAAGAPVRPPLPLSVSTRPAEEAMPT